MLDSPFFSYWGKAKGVAFLHHGNIASGLKVVKRRKVRDMDPN